MITRSKSKLNPQMLTNIILEKKPILNNLSKTRSGKIYSNLNGKRKFDYQISKYKNERIEINYYATILLSLRNSI